MDNLEIELLLNHLGVSKFKDEVFSRERNLVRDGKLISLDLSGLTISNFPKDLLKGFEYLEYLDLSNNQIGSIPKNSFYSQIKLTELNLSNNKLTSLPRDLFTRTQKLRILNLSGNSIGALPDFSKLHMLEELNLFENPLHNFPVNALSNMMNLKHLNLRSCQLNEIKEGTFDNLRHLESLNLGDNNLKELDRQLSSLPIQDLYLDQNKLESIPNINPANLKSLWLHGNLLTGESLKDAFHKMPKLTHLFLNENQIEFIGNGIFDELSHLEFLLLNGNKIQHIDGACFKSLISLKELWLMDNPLPESGYYNGTEAIQNLIQRLEDSAVLRGQILDILKSIGLENKLEMVMARKGTVFREKKLVKVDLSELGIQDINGAVFEQSPYIEELNLSGNELTFLPSGFLDNLLGLRRLDLSKNRLRRIEKGVFHHKELELIDLSENNLPKSWNKNFNNEFDVSEFLEKIDLDIDAYEQISRFLEENYLSESILESHYTHISGGKITSLDLSECNLRKLPVQIEEFKDLKQLRLNSNNLVEVELSIESLELLDLRDNKIEQLLTRLPNLHYLYLGRNSITEIPNLDSSPNLLELGLEGNKLKGINRNSFPRGITELNLSNISIMRLQEDTFKNLEELEILDLSGNYLEEIPQDLFNNNKKLQLLDLSGNLLGDKGRRIEGNLEILAFIREMVTRT